SELLKNKARTIRVKEADNVLDEVFFQAMANERDIIVDSGGGDDANRLLELLSVQPQDNIKYIIPTTVGADDTNVMKTYKLIPNKNNILFVLNGYHDLENLKEEFLFFFGDADDDIEGVVGKIKGKLHYLLIPFSNLYKVAQLKYNMTVLDLANLSKNLTPEEASKVFITESAGDPLAYRALYKRYKQSVRAQKLIDEIMYNLSKIDKQVA
ncbi:MAG: hypothetical protein Q7S59_06455, partial [Sulfurimonas sp.]|nr:hypothetical protein [Sulfurimonas sp.]